MIEHFATADWPDPVEVVNERGRSPFVLICEHASNYIPAEYIGLGLPREDLVRHIAWDIGAADLTRSLATRLDAVAFLSAYSRLLIDLNRPLGSQTSIPTRSEATDIPGNFAVDERERRRRAERMFDPFHGMIDKHLDSRFRLGRPTRILTIHSFVPNFLGVSRPWHAGVLFAKAEDFADEILTGLRRDPALNIQPNVPYRITPDGDYSVPCHGDKRGIPAVLVEIRHDLIADGRGVEDWTKRLAASVAVPVQ
jgi:predicted N-formylglutamate amidohydrolase